MSRQTSTNVEVVEIHFNEVIKCLTAKANPIRKIEAIKIVKENEEILK